MSTVSLQDTELFGAGSFVEFTCVSNLLSLRNNLFQNVHTVVSTYEPTISINNCFTADATYEVLFENDGGAPMTNLNNVYDGSDVYVDGTYGYNAYLNGAILEMSTNTGDIITDLAWVTGPLGSYYQATNSPLRNNGSATADQLGLYHYTVTTNEVPETNSIVDIGYHYVALGGNGLPLDSNGDGIPDYLEDSNGDGVYNVGDLANWQGSANPDTNGLVGLQVYTPLR